MKRRSCARGVLANEGSKFSSLERCKNVDNFPGTSRDSYSYFGAKRDSASVSTKLKLTATERMAKRSCRIISMVKSNTLAKNVTCRTLGGTSDIGNGFVVILGSGGVSVSRGIKNVDRCLSNFHATSTCESLGGGIVGSLGRVPVCKRHVMGRVEGAGDDVGRLFVPNVFFRRVNVVCLKPISNDSVGRVYHIFSRTGHISNPILIRILAGGKTNCNPTRHCPSEFRKTRPFIVRAKLPGGGHAGTGCASIFSAIVGGLNREGPGMITVATTVTSKAKLHEFRHGFPSEFFSIKVTRTRTAAFTTKLTGTKLVPMFTICSSFLRETFSRVLRSIYVRGLRIVFTVSETKLMNDSKRARRNVFSVSCLSIVPGVAVVTPGGG